MAASVGLPQRRDTSNVGGARVMLHTDEQVIPRGWPPGPRVVTMATPVGKTAIIDRKSAAMVVVTAVWCMSLDSGC